jgi:hypothetical protein
MSHFDVFNGDADGLCALHQLRLAQPRAAELVTGLKRDNALLARISAGPGDSVTVLDISMDTNRKALLALLERGAHIEYFDHHRVADPPIHPNLMAVIDTAADVCTSVLVDRHLGGRHRPWAVVGAFGDAMSVTAKGLATTLGLNEHSLEKLHRLGEYLNYNSYGESAADQMYRPETLCRLMQPYPDPLRFLASEAVYECLAEQYAEDLEKALSLSPAAQEESAAVFRLPDAAWARRIIGTFANHLASAAPGRAHAVLVSDVRGHLTGSLRVPAGAILSADRFAARYGGSGRVTAAGIGGLPSSEVTAFAEDFLRTYRALPDQAEERTR